MVYTPIKTHASLIELTQKKIYHSYIKNPNTLMSKRSNRFIKLAHGK